MRIICCLISFLILSSFVKMTAYQRYQTGFINFTHSVNKFMPEKAQKDLAWKNWELANGNFPLAVRLAAKENHESGHFKLAAWNDPNLPPEKLWPRYDCLGSNLNLIVQQAKKLKITKADIKNYHSDEMDHLKEQCANDPAWGTWIVGHAYIDKVKLVGMDRASHWWQTGKSYFNSREEYQNDDYLRNIKAGEKMFYEMMEGKPRNAAVANKNWRVAK